MMKLILDFIICSYTNSPRIKLKLFITNSFALLLHKTNSSKNIYKAPTDYNRSKLFNGYNNINGIFLMGNYI